MSAPYWHTKERIENCMINARSFKASGEHSHFVKAFVASARKINRELVAGLRDGSIVVPPPPPPPMTTHELAVMLFNGPNLPVCLETDAGTFQINGTASTTAETECVNWATGPMIKIV
jgi:hypothetical protein